MDLPNDILVDILMKMPGNSLGCIQCASKTCLNIVESPFFATLHTPRFTNPTAFEVPKLMLLARSSTWLDFTSKALHPSTYNGKFALGKTKEALLVSHTLSPKLYSNVGFVFRNLFFIQSYKMYGPGYLLNPERKEVLGLPKSNIKIPDYVLNWYGMGFDNITNTYKIVRVCKIEKDNSQVAQVYALGTTSSWREIQSVPPDVLSYKNASAYGDMHWLIQRDEGNCKKNIISFDFKKEEFNWTPLPKLKLDFVPPFGSGYIHLLNLRGSLAIVALSSDIEVWVLKNYDKKEWMLDYKIDTQMFVWHRDTVFSESASCGEWEHGIFFVGQIHKRYFLDLRYGTLNRVTLPTFSINNKCCIFKGFKVLSYTESPIPLNFWQLGLKYNQMHDICET